MTNAEDTWEKWLDLLKAYPECNHEDKVKTDQVDNDEKVRKNGPKAGNGPNQEGMGNNPGPQRKKRDPIWSCDYVGIP